MGREGVRLESAGARHDAESMRVKACVMQRKEKHARCACMCIAERALDAMLVAKPKAVDGRKVAPLEEERRRNRRKDDLKNAPPHPPLKF